MLVIAALFHDIGKFYQRTGIWIDITDYKKYLVFRDNKYQYYHAAYTGCFLDKYFNNSQLTSLSASHHLHKNTLIKRSDIIAAAHDRRDSDYDLNSSEDYILMRLSSIFHLIGEGKKTHILSLQNYARFTGFCEDSKRTLIEAKAEYLQLFQEFTKKIDGISSLLLEQGYHNIYYFMKEYLFAIPAATFQTSHTYVSLFDHLKLTAAIANCLEKSKLKKQFIIIKYHLHGISDFVYQDDDLDLIYGRSIYLKLLCEFIVYAILNTFAIGYENIIYSLGGQGRILAPNNINIIQKLKMIYDIIDDIVNISHDGIINFVLSYDIYDDIDLKQGKFKKNLQENEKIVLKTSKKEIKDNKDKKIIDYISIAEKIINNNVIIEYNFGKYSHNINGIIFDGLGSITINPLNYKNKSYYESYNGGFLGETKEYCIVRNYRINNNAVMIFMDLKNTNNIFMNKIKNTSQSFSTFLTLSRTLELFFSRIVPKVCRDYAVNLIYTSGDDIIMIADKSNALTLITEIKKSFNNYTSNNKEFIWNICVKKLNNTIHQTYKEIKNTI